MCTATWIYLSPRDRRLSHQPRHPPRQSGGHAPRTNSPFAKGPADRERCGKRDRARHGQREADRYPPEQSQRSVCPTMRTRRNNSERVGIRDFDGADVLRSTPRALNFGSPKGCGPRVPLARQRHTARGPSALASRLRPCRVGFATEDRVAFVVDDAPKPQLRAGSNHRRLIETPPRWRPSPSPASSRATSGPNFKTSRQSRMRCLDRVPPKDRRPRDDGAKRD